MIPEKKLNIKLCMLPSSTQTKSYSLDQRSDLYHKFSIITPLLIHSKSFFTQLVPQVERSSSKYTILQCCFVETVVAGNTESLNYVGNNETFNRRWLTMLLEIIEWENYRVRENTTVWTFKNDTLLREKTYIFLKKVDKSESKYSRKDCK